MDEPRAGWGVAAGECRCPAVGGKAQERKCQIQTHKRLCLEIEKPPSQRTVLLLPLSLSSLPLMQGVIRDGQKLTSQMPTLYFSWEEEQKSWFE